MVNVDISNIWSALSLPELLEIEQEVSAAHPALEDSSYNPCSAGELLRLIAVAEGLRGRSRVCVVVGKQDACSAARAAVELLQGAQRNLTRGQAGDPRILFAGDSFSSRQWNTLRQLLEDADFSVIAVSGAELAPETAVALRNLKWMLERRYGTDEASRRICAVTDPDNGPLGEMARMHHWELLPQKDWSGFAPLSPAALLIMAAAGLDAAGLAAGADSLREELELRSFENPLWLYGAVRTLMYRRGRQGELLAAWEPDFLSLGRWWQRQLLPGGLPVILDTPSLPGSALFATALHFEPAGVHCEISGDVHDTDGLNTLAGRSLEEVQEQSFLQFPDVCADAGTPVLTMDCGPLCEHTLGQLFYFLSMAGNLCARLREGTPE